MLAYLGIPSAVITLCSGLLKARINKRDKTHDECEAAREKNEVLLVQSIGAPIALGEACAIAMRDGRTNGETEATLEYAKKMKREQKDFLTEQGIRNLY